MTIHLSTRRDNPICRDKNPRCALTADPRLVTCAACKASPAWAPAVARHSSTLSHRAPYRPSQP